VTRPLAESVYVAGRFFAAGDVPDEEFAALITNPKAWGDDTGTTPAAASAPQDPDEFDPSADGISVDDVNNHLANADEAEVQRVLAAEAAGKNRKGVVEGPYADAV
jgi:hypothetical protein